ncbi:MAG: hypothetical protein ACR2LI_18010 [Propionibacteriaceae bacterium]
MTWVAAALRANPRSYLKVRDTAMHKLGIGTTHDMNSVITGIFLVSWRFRGDTLQEKVNLARTRNLRATRCAPKAALICSSVISHLAFLIEDCDW